MSRSALLPLLLGLLLLATQPETYAAPELFVCTTAGIQSFSDRPCGPDAQPLVLPDQGRTPSGGQNSGKNSDARQIEAWERASVNRLPPSLGGKSSSNKALSGAKARPATTTPAEKECAEARAALTQAESRTHLDFNARRKFGDRIWAACSQ